MADPTSKLFDEEADEEDDDLAPQEDEQVPEEEKNEYVVDGFVVGDDDEGLIPAPKPDGASSSDDEEEDENRLKRNREEDELADLQLIQDNLQQQEPKKQKRDAVDDLFADDSDDEPAKPVKKKDGLFDEDDFDDFIEDDLGIQQALKREHEASLKGARDGPATDVSQMQLMDMVDIFGEEKLEDLSDEEAPVQREKPSTLSRFEPQMLKEYYVTGDDENIRRRDIPERLQCRQLPTVRRRRAQFERDLDAESKWVASKMKKSSEEEVEAVKRCLVFFNEDALEPPYVAAYRRDDLAPVRVEELWRIHDLDEEWCSLTQKRKDSQRFVKAVHGAGEGRCSLSVAQQACLETDATAYADARAYARQQAAKHGLITSQARRPARREAAQWAKAKASGVDQFARKFTLRPQDLDKALRSNDVKLPPTPSESVDMLCLDYVGVGDCDTEERVRTNAIAVAARELAALPSVREACRTEFRKKATLQSSPTEKGRQEIDPSHEFHGLQRLRDKPVSTFLDGAMGRQRRADEDPSDSLDDLAAADYVRLLKAEQEGLISTTITYGGPEAIAARVLAAYLAVPFQAPVEAADPAAGAAAALATAETWAPPVQEVAQAAPLPPRSSAAAFMDEAIPGDEPVKAEPAAAAPEAAPADPATAEAMAMARAAEAAIQQEEGASEDAAALARAAEAAIAAEEGSGVLHERGGGGDDPMDVDAAPAAPEAAAPEPAAPAPAPEPEAAAAPTEAAPAPAPPSAADIFGDSSDDDAAAPAAPADEPAATEPAATEAAPEPAAAAPAPMDADDSDDDFAPGPPIKKGSVPAPKAADAPKAANDDDSEDDFAPGPPIKKAVPEPEPIVPKDPKKRRVIEDDGLSDDDDDLFGVAAPAAAPEKPSVQEDSDDDVFGEPVAEEEPEPEPEEEEEDFAALDLSGEAEEEPVKDDATPTEEVAQQWDALRREVVTHAIEKLLAPLFIDEIRLELKRRGQKAVASLAANALRRMADVQPFAVVEGGSNGLAESAPQRLEGCSAVGICVPRPNSEARCERRRGAARMGDSTIFAALAPSGALVAQEGVSSRATERDMESLRVAALFLRNHLPDIVVVSTSAGMGACRRTLRFIGDALAAARTEYPIPEDEMLDAAMRREEEQDNVNAWNPTLAFADDGLARCYAASVRSDRELGKTASMGLRIATSLARSAQDPLAELTYAFTSLGLKNGTGLGLAGEELVALPLHPLQAFVRPKELLQAFERTLVDQVCRSGVDVNRALQYDHHFGKLQFVAGLGPRKAQALRRAARSGAGAAAREGGGHGMVTSRRAMAALFDTKNHKEERGSETVCFQNAAGFLRVQATGPLQDAATNPLDDTRIHPECYFDQTEGISYDFAQKICSDALDRDFDRDDPEGYQDVVIAALDDSRTRMEKDLRKQQQNEFGDKAFWSPPPFGAPLSGADEGADEALDDKISELDLDAYAQLLEGEGKGKRRLMLEDIKRELRTPYRDLRQPWRRPPDSLVFKWLTAGGDNGQIRPRQIVAARIQRADKYRVFTTTDLGVQGGLHQDYLDVNGQLVENCDEWLREKNRRPPFDAQLGLEDVIECAILKVDPERMRVELSRRDDDVFFPSDSHAYYAATTDSVDACLDVAAVVQDYVDLASQRKKRAQDVRKQKEERARLDALPKRKARRAITHPAYRPNCDYRQAEELLSRMDPGEVILRPSSSGKVALTWAFRQNVYRHVEIDETEKKYKIDEEEYEDLDELLARYVLPMNDLTEDVCRHRKYDAELSDPDAASEKLMALRRAAPSSIPYVLWVDPRYPGRFALTYLAPRASRPKNEWVKVTPEGLELRERRYFATHEVLNYFKRHAKDWAKGAKLAPHRAEPKKAQPVPVPLQPIQQQWAPPPQQQAWGAPPPQQGWGAAPPQQGWGAPPPQQQWGAQPPPRPMAGGPQGRGRGTTLPAWMTAQNQ